MRRPSDYNPSLAATLGPSQPNPNLNLAAVGLTPGSAGGLEGPDRIFVGGLPYYFTEAQIKELLESFGPLRGFDLVKDRETGNSKGYAFCVYQDLSVTDIACAALNGIKMGDKTLTVRRANQGANQPKPEQESVLLHAQQQIALQVDWFCYLLVIVLSFVFFIMIYLLFCYMKKTLFGLFFCRGSCYYNSLVQQPPRLYALLK